MDGVDDFIKNNQNQDQFGKEVIVIGGGDTALDCARTALRLTKGNVTIVYRRTENDMPADPIMLEEAKEEGVKFRFLGEPKSYEGENGHVVGTIACASRWRLVNLMSQEEGSQNLFLTRGLRWSAQMLY